jgi:sensor domain CHASE-containing protein
MAIGSAVQKGQYVFVYDEKGRTLFSKSGGSGASDGLVGFTGSTVSVRIGSYVFTYDEQGRTLFSKSVG